MAREIDRLIAEAEPLLDQIARQVSRRLGGLVPLDDLLALGRPALHDAAARFDASRATFRTYAAHRIRWAIYDGVRSETHGRSVRARALALLVAERVAEADDPPRPDGLATEQDYQQRLRVLLEQRAAALAVALVIADDTTLAGAEVDPEEHAVRRQTARMLRDAMATLPDRERQLVDRHYYGGEQFDAIARDLGISKSWASRLHAQAITRLGKALRRAPAKTAPPPRKSAAAED